MKMGEVGREGEGEKVGAAEETLDGEVRASTVKFTTQREEE